MRTWRTKNPHISFIPSLEGQFVSNNVVTNAHAPQHSSSECVSVVFFKNGYKLFDILLSGGKVYIPSPENLVSLWLLWSASSGKVMLYDVRDYTVLPCFLRHSLLEPQATIQGGWQPYDHYAGGTKGRSSSQLDHRAQSAGHPAKHLPGLLRVTPVSDPSRCHLRQKHLPAEPWPKFLYTALWGIMKCCFKPLSFGIIRYAATDNWNHIQQKSVHMCTQRYVQKCLLYHCLKKQTIGNNLNLYQEKNRF